MSRVGEIVKIVLVEAGGFGLVRCWEGLRTLLLLTSSDNHQAENTIEWKHEAHHHSLVKAEKTTHGVLTGGFDRANTCSGFLSS